MNKLENKDHIIQNLGGAIHYLNRSALFWEKVDDKSKHPASLRKAAKTLNKYIKKISNQNI